MRWYALLSLFSGTQITFLIGIAVIAVIVAVYLTYMEKKVKEKAKIHEEVNALPIKNLEEIKNSDKSPEEKLKLLNKESKQIFQNRFNLESSKTYSELSTEFEKLKKWDLAEFCKRMNSLHYKESNVTQEKITESINSLIKIINQKLIENMNEDLLNESKKPNPSKIGKLEKITFNKLKYLEKIINNKGLINKQNKRLEKTINKIDPEKIVPFSMKKLSKDKQKKIIEISEKIEKADKILERIKKNKKVINISNQSKTKEEFFSKLIKNNRKSYIKLLDAHKLLEKAIEDIKNLIKEFYTNESEEEKKKIKRIFRDWKKEKIRIMKSTEDPLKNNLSEKNMVKKHFIKLKAIMSSI